MANPNPFDAGGGGSDFTTTPSNPATPPTTPPTMTQKIKAQLTQKRAKLPTWAWVGGALAVLGIASNRGKK